MLKKRLMAVGVAAVFTLSSLTTTVLAADNNKSYTNPGKGVISKWGDTEKKHKFNDYTDASWAVDAIEKLAGKGVINGVGKGLFAPNSKVTNLEAIAMVYRLIDKDTLAESLNNQVNQRYKGKKTPWGQGYINLAIKEGILLEDELDDFNPLAPAKRHEIAKYIIRALGDKETKEAEKAMDEDLSFRDAKDIPEESVGYVYMVSKLGIMVGDKNNKFSPMVPVTRAEMAVLLDRAEGKFDIPDTDRRKNGTVFVSVNEDDNKITVKINGISTTFEYLDDVNVYKDGKFVDVEDLKAGDVLQLIFNKDKKIIFIEVKKNITEEEANVSFTEVEYKNLPKELKDEVDSFKDKVNYKAFEYKDYIYLVASMGEKSTGGYSVDFKKLSKALDNGKYTLTAVVELDKPTSGAITTQNINYPLSVAKFKSFDNIENIVFVDEHNDELDKDVDIEELDAEVEETSVKGDIYSINSSDDKITVVKSNGVKATFEIPTDADIEVNGDAADFEDLEIGMYVELSLEDDEVVSVEAESIDKVEGKITDINSSKDEITVEKSNGVKVTYKIPSDADIEVNGHDDAVFDDLEKGMKVELDIEDGEVVAVDAEDAEEEIAEIEGTINAVNSTRETIDVKKSNGNVVTLTIPDDADITVNEDEKADFEDLKAGMSVEIEVTDDEVTKVVAEDKTIEVKGKLTQINLGSEDKIILLVDGKYKTYTVDSDVEIITDKDSTAEVEDL
ncbi:MAG: S-layer homology domain-containing protein, partial [Pseudomonadota bacterium]